MFSESPRPNEAPMTETGEILSQEVPNGIVYGESHMYNVDITELPSWSEVKKRARQTDHAFLEHTTDVDKNAWVLASTYTYMRAAELNARAYKHPVTHLDPFPIAAIEYRENKTKTHPIEIFFQHYQESGVPLTREEIMFIHAAITSIAIPLDEEWISKIQQLIQNIYPECSPTNAYQIVTYVIKANAGVGTKEQPNILLNCVHLEAQVRERAMQETLAQQLQEEKPSNFLVLVGAYHFDGIVKTCQNPSYRTPIDTTLVSTIEKHLEGMDPLKSLLTKK